MSEEVKQPLQEDPPPAQEGAQAEPQADQATQPQGDAPQAEEPTGAAEEKAGGRKSKKKEKEKGYTFTREQVEQMELAAKQLASVKDQFTRLSAEYDNYRKRTAREKDHIYQDAKADTVKAFLAVYDNLKRAMGTQGDEDSPHRKGLEMIFNQYRDILEKLGVTEIEALGRPFDPEKHNAVMHVEDESLGENVVAQVFQAGFMLEDKVLRCAIVQVAN